MQARRLREQQVTRSMSQKTNDLTLKEEIFVREYLKDGNATRAVIAAGYAEKSASVTGSKLLRKAKVREKLANLQGKLYEKLEISAEKVLQGIAQLAFFDVRKFYDAEGKLIAVKDLDDMTAAALLGMDVEKLYKHFGKGQAEEVGTISKIKLADRGLNLERLGRHLKLFTDKVQVTGLEDLAGEIEKARRRAQA